MFCIDPGRGLIPVWIPASVRCQAEAKLHIKPIQQIGYRGEWRTVIQRGWKEDVSITSHSLNSDILDTVTFNINMQ